MPSESVVPEEPPLLGPARIPDPQHPTMPAFLTACCDRNYALALQLAPDQEPETLTYGLNDAFKMGHFQLARQLLNSGAQWDFRTVSVASRSLNAIVMMVSRGFNVNTPMWHGATVFSMAVMRNNESVIRYLLAQGADPNLGPPINPHGPFDQVRPIPNSGVALNNAAAQCTPEIFALMLEHGAVLSNSIALHRAAGVSQRVPPGERIPMLEYLLSLGLDINAMDEAIRLSETGQGQCGSPLHYAVDRARVEEARWLLEHGADPDTKTQYGISARDLVKKRYPPDHKLSILLLAD